MLDRLIRSAFAFASLSLGCTDVALSQQSAPIRISELGFSPELRLNVEQRERILSFIGEAERSFLFFDIYNLAYYRELTNQDEQKRIEVLKLVYERDLSKEKVHGVLIDGIKANLNDRDFDKVRDDIDDLLSSIGIDVNEGDRLTIIKQFSDKLDFRFNGEFILSIDNPLLICAIWNIWMGEQSVIDLNSLTKGQR